MGGRGPPGHRRVQSYVRIGSAVAPFVAEVLVMLSIADGAGSRVRLDQVSGLLSGVDTPGLGTITRRAYLLSAHALANYLRFHDGLLLAQPQVREATRRLCEHAAAAAVNWLGQDDPASLLLTGYSAYLRAWDLGREPAADPAARTAAAADLVSQLDRMAAAWRGRLADPGTASYLLEIGAMALDRLRVSGFGDRLAELWRTAMLARGSTQTSTSVTRWRFPRRSNITCRATPHTWPRRQNSVADLRRAARCATRLRSGAGPSDAR